MQKSVIIAFIIIACQFALINSYGIFYTTYMPQIKDNGNTIILNKNNRITLLNSDNTEYPSKQDFAYFNLVGSSISYDIDLSQAGCGCNAAVYMVDLQSINDGATYCDANNVGNHWCTEMDIMEANTHGIHTSAHCCCYNSCNGTPGDQCVNGGDNWSTCDQWGYVGGYGGYHSESFDQQNAYGPGKVIDTNKPFHFEQSYTSTHITTKLSQGSQTITMNHNNSNYMGKMSYHLQKGMSIIMSLWDGDMTWLDGQEGGCSSPEYCDVNSVWVTISNMYINGQHVVFGQKQSEVISE